MVRVLTPNRLCQCEVAEANAALASLLGASCHSPALSHAERMASHAAITRVVTFAARELSRRRRRAEMRRLARNQAYDAYLADKYAAEELGAALQAERISDLLYGERDFAEGC